MKDFFDKDVSELIKTVKPSYIFYGFIATVANFAMLIFASAQNPWIGSLSNEEKCKLACSKSSLKDCLDSCASNSKNTTTASNQFEEILLSRPLYIIVVLLIIVIGLIVAKINGSRVRTLKSEQASATAVSNEANKIESEDFLEKLI